MTIAVTGVMGKRVKTLTRWLTDPQPVRIFPALLAHLITSVVALVVLLVIASTFAGIYEDLGSDLPTPTAVVVAVTHLLTTHWYFVPLLLGVLLRVDWAIFSTLQKHISEPLAGWFWLAAVPIFQVTIGIWWWAILTLPV